VGLHADPNLLLSNHVIGLRTRPNFRGGGVEVLRGAWRCAGQIARRLAIGGALVAAVAHARPWLACLRRAGIGILARRYGLADAWRLLTGRRALLVALRGALRRVLRGGIR